MSFLSSLFNNLNATNNHYQSEEHKNEPYSDYPDVFFTNQYQSNNKTYNYSQYNEKNYFSQQSNNQKSELLTQLLPVLLGKNFDNQNIIANLLNTNTFKNQNNKTQNLLECLNLFNNTQKKQENNKKDMPNIIDMSEYNEIKKL